MAKIRKFALFTTLVLCTCSVFNTLSAQDTEDDQDQRTFYGGLLFGVNLTQVDGDNYAGYHKAGLNAGGIVYMNLGEHIAPSLEILFSQKGSRGHKEQLSNTNTYLIQHYDIKLNYAEVPIMLNYFDRRKSHFGAGFSYSQLISSQETVVTPKTGSTSVFPDSIDLDKAYPFRKFDINFLISGSLHLYKGLFLDVRFQYSVIPIRKTIYPEFGRAEQYNNLYAVRLKYLF